MRNNIILISIILIIYIPLSLLDYNHFPFSDGAEHGAAVRELAKNLIHPEDPMLANHSGKSPRFVPSTLLMAICMRLLHLDVLITLKVFLVFFFSFFLVSATLFSRQYFKDTAQAPWSLATLLFLWGLGWTGANAYMFSAILYTAYFPSVVSFSLSLLALYFQLRFLQSFKTRFLIVEIICGSLAFINHPLTGTFFFICSGLIYIEKRSFEKKMMFCYVLSVLAALSLTALWPYYSFFTNFSKIASGQMAQTADYQSTHQYLYSKFFIRSGPALLGIPFVILFLWQKRYLLLVGGFAFFSLFYLAGYLFKISLAERFVFFIMFTLQMSFSRICREWFLQSASTLDQNVKRIIAWFFPLFLIIGIGIQLVLVYTKFITPSFEHTAGFTFPKYVSPNTMQMELRKHLCEGDVVLSDIYSSWSIPVYTGAKVIALFHTPPNVDDNSERIKAVETFYDGDTSSEERMKILKEYGVTHIFLNYKITGEDIKPALQEMGFSVIAQNESFCLFSVFRTTRNPQLEPRIENAIPVSRITNSHT